MISACAFAGPLAPLEYPGDGQRFRPRLEPAMPRFPDKNLDGVVFLYRTVEEAQQRVRKGATGFIVGVPIPGSDRKFGKTLYLPYIVTNRHVALEGSACVASVNRKDGGAPDVWDIDQNDWIAHPGGDDLAATCAIGFVNKAIHRFTFIESGEFVGREDIAKFHIGIGDDVFMVGRFINHRGQTENEPALRFGNVSVGLTHIPASAPGGGQRMQESFAVEMRSRTGFSGSPVCIYRSRGTSMTTIPDHAEHFWALLGVNWGFIIDEDGENTWLNGVVPAWKIQEVLDTPALKAHLHQHTEKVSQLPDQDPGITRLGVAE